MMTVHEVSSLTGVGVRVENLLIWQKNVLEVDMDLFSKLSRAQKWIYAKLVVGKQEKTITGMEKEFRFSIPIIVTVCFVDCTVTFSITFL